MNYIEAMQNQLPAEVETLTAEIQVYKQQAGACIVEIGRRLIQAKELLPHGQWASWLAEKVEFSEKTAQNFMRVAREYANPQPVADLGLSKALLLLQLPEEEREEFIEKPHEVGGEEKTVQEMSKRELEKVIRERDEARKAAEAAQADAVRWKSAADAGEVLLENTKSKLESAKGELESAKNELESAAKQAEVAAEEREAAEKAFREAEKRQKELAVKLKAAEEAARAEPIPAEVVPDEETLEHIRAEIRAEQADVLKAAEERVAEASARLERAKNPAALRVSLCFEDVQAKITVIESALRDLRGDQPEAADRFCDVISEFFNQCALRIGG